MINYSSAHVRASAHLTCLINRRADRNRYMKKRIAANPEVVGNNPTVMLRSSPLLMENDLLCDVQAACFARLIRLYSIFSRFFRVH